MSLEDIQFPDSKCPVCKAYYEDAGMEEFKAGFRLTVCSQCGYTFDAD